MDEQEPVLSENIKKRGLFVINGFFLLVLSIFGLIFGYYFESLVTTIVGVGSLYSAYRIPKSLVFK